MGTVAKIAYCMGKKTVHTDYPTEKIGAKVLEASIDLDPVVKLAAGLRVDVFAMADGSMQPMGERRAIAPGRGVTLLAALLGLDSRRIGTQL